MPNFANSQKRENCSQLQIMKWPKVSIGKKIKVCDQLSLNRVRLTQIFASPDAEEEITLDIDSLSVSDALVHSHTYALTHANLRSQMCTLTRTSIFTHPLYCNLHSLSHTLANETLSHFSLSPTRILPRTYNLHNTFL